MKLEPSGITLYPAELRAFLKFCSKDPENPLCRVNFRTEGATLVAYATNGNRALQAVGEVEGENCVEGEWSVFRDFLAAGLKLLTENQYLTLEVQGDSIKGATVIDSETFEICAELTWPTDAAANQANFPHETLKQHIKLPVTERPVRCISVRASYMADLAVVAKAAGSDSLDIYPPKSREDGVVFAIEEEGLTAWRSIIMPLRKEASETDDGTENQDGEIPRGRKGKKSRQPELSYAGGQELEGRLTKMRRTRGLG